MCNRLTVACVEQTSGLTKKCAQLKAVLEWPFKMILVQQTHQLSCHPGDTKLWLLNIMLLQSRTMLELEKYCQICDEKHFLSVTVVGRPLDSPQSCIFHLERKKETQGHPVRDFWFHKFPHDQNLGQNWWEVSLSVFQTITADVPINPRPQGPLHLGLLHDWDAGRKADRGDLYRLVQTSLLSGITIPSNTIQSISLL